MILVGQYDSPGVRRVAVTLQALGVAFERNPLAVFSDAAAMRLIQRLGRVPSLVLDDGDTLSDNEIGGPRAEAQAGLARFWGEA